MVVHLPDPKDPLRLAGCLCPNCRYELKGVRNYQCPECGTEIDVNRARFGEPPPTKMRKRLHRIAIAFWSIVAVWDVVSISMIVYWGGITVFVFFGLVWFVVFQFFFFYEYLME